LSVGMRFRRRRSSSSSSSQTAAIPSACVCSRWSCSWDERRGFPSLWCQKLSSRRENEDLQAEREF
jgi:hypothetical protein